MKLGKDVYISPKATIQGDNIVIGDGSWIGDDVQILCDNFELGDYCKIHNHTTIHGNQPIKIGHNAWIGQGTIIDGLGGITIGNNCGIGAYSQLWSHIRYGDPLKGCNYNSSKPLVVGDDVWFVGHCIVSPITAKNRSMALVGSVITKDMEEDHIYGGSPAKDLTGKVPPQFSNITLEDKWKMFEEIQIPEGIVLVDDDQNIPEVLEHSYFNIADGTYTKRLTVVEIEFMRTMQSMLFKFTPKSQCL